MKDKSFVVCIIGIILFIITGIYVYYRDDGIQQEGDIEDKGKKQERNFEENSCSAGEITNSNQRTNRDYRIGFNWENINEYIEDSDNDFFVMIPWVSFETLERTELEGKINGSIQDASTNWITEDIKSIYENNSNFVVLCHTDDYLSFCQTYGTISTRHMHCIEDYITIDMNTGEQVFLHDILDVDKLCDFLLQNDQYTTRRQNLLEQEEADEGIRAMVKEYSREELRDMLKQCSMEQKDFYNWCSESGNLKSPSVQWRANFCLQSTQLAIILYGEWHNQVIIKYKDLDGILKEDFKKKMLN